MIGIFVKHMQTEMWIFKNKGFYNSCINRVSIENFPKTIAREKFEFILWHKLYSIHQTVLMSGVGLVAMKLEPFK